MKIVCVDNFNRDSVSDWLVAENINNEELGEKIVNFLNDSEGPNNQEYFRLVSDSYELYRFEP